MEKTEFYSNALIAALPVAAANKSISEVSGADLGNFSQFRTSRRQV
jgi:hypothetical protein